MLIEKLRDRILKPDPAWSRTGYWVGVFGGFLTVAMVLGSFFSPQIRASKFFKIPPCLILAGLALEVGEVLVVNRRAQ